MHYDKGSWLKEIYLLLNISGNTNNKSKREGGK
jgi:hypothetical protein